MGAKLKQNQGQDCLGKFINFKNIKKDTEQRTKNIN